MKILVLILLILIVVGLVMYDKYLSWRNQREIAMWIIKTRMEKNKKEP